VPSAAPPSAPTPSPSPSPTPSATPTPSPTPSPTPKARPTPTKKPASDRYKLLKECPNTADCWIYTVRSGDNLSSIANYFGHPLRTIYAWNPRYPGTPLRVGAQIRMPPPTR
jgi:LysM repeat protein